MPVVTRFVGYFPGRFFGLPEDLPFGVALQWARRRRLIDLRGDTSRNFNHIKASVLVVRPVDDPFATKKALSRVEQQFSSAHFTDISVRAEVGHFGFFRKRNRDRLWPLALEWLGRWSKESLAVDASTQAAVL